MKKLLLLSTLFLLTSCVNQREHVEIVDLRKEYAKKETHVVHAQKNETLYSVAWRTGHDFGELVRINKINPSKKLKEGKAIYLVEKQSSIIDGPPKAPLPQTLKQEPQKTLTKQVTTKAHNKDWVWPIQGQVSAGFGEKVLDIKNKGIDIKPQQSDSEVKATADGKIVYSGCGLKGYGQMIIIKHDDLYLSAYAQNSKILVYEGEIVQKGQIIATVNVTGGSKDFHFEIRENGVPVNPLLFLR